MDREGEGDIEEGSEGGREGGGEEGSEGGRERGGEEGSERGRKKGRKGDRECPCIHGMMLAVSVAVTTHMAGH